MKYFAILILALSVLSCNNSEKKNNQTKLESVAIKKAKCIENILQRDSELGDIRNHASEQSSLSKTIDDYANSVKSLDFKNCPDKFTIAFHKHIKAWLDLKKVSDKYPELRGELHEIFSELEKKKDSIEFKLRQAKIFDTWKIVEEITKA
jgi:vacuolar-type H+-ATPase subunit I/STV1